MSGKIFILLIISLIHTIYVFGQSDIKRCRYHVFDESQSLFSKNVSDIQEDEQNQIWVIANNQIQYFDGSQFSEITSLKIYKPFFIKYDTINPFVMNGLPVYWINSKVRKIEIIKQNFKPSHGQILICETDLENQFKVYNTEKNREIKVGKRNYYGILSGQHVLYLKENFIHIFDLKRESNKEIYLDKIKLRHSFVAFHFPYLFFVNENKRLMVFDVKNEKFIETDIKVESEIRFGRISASRNRSGNILCGVNNRIYELNETFTVINEFRGFDNNTFVKRGFIEKIMSDKFDNIYILTLKEGLVKVIIPEYDIRYFGRYGDERDFCKAILADKSRNLIITGTWGDGMHAYDTTGNYLFSLEDKKLLKKDAVITFFSKVGDGKYIFSAFRDSALYALEFLNNSYNYRISKLSGKISVDNFNVKEISLDENKSLLMLTTEVQMLYKKPEVRLVKLFDTNMAFDMAVDGNIVYVTTTGCINTYDLSSGKLQKKYKMPIGQIRVIQQKDSDTYYLGSDKGLYLFKPKEGTYQQAIFPTTTVFSVVKDFSGNLWFGTASGIYKWNGDIITLHLRKFDGLQDWEFNTNVTARTPDGEMIFGGVYGANAFYPEAKIIVESNAGTLIDEIQTLTKNLNHSIAWNDNVSLPDNDQFVKIKLLHRGRLLPTEYNYQYVIPGREQKWIDLKNNQYVNLALSKGENKICFHSGYWFDENIPVKNCIYFSVFVPFYLRSWVWYLFFTGLFIVSLFIIYQYKNIQLLKTKASYDLKNQLWVHKERMAKELHDNVGSQLSIIARTVSWILEKKDKLNPSDIEIKLEQISKLATKINTDIRDTIWAVKKEEISLEEFVFRLKSFVSHIPSEELVVNFSENVPDNRLQTQEALNLLRICQESIVNAWKYSQSKVVEVNLFINARSHLQLEIKDYGVGFNNHPDNFTGNGLVNMQERAKQIGYNFNMHSLPGLGVTISLEKQIT